MKANSLIFSHTIRPLYLSSSKLTQTWEVDITESHISILIYSKMWYISAYHFMSWINKQTSEWNKKSVIIHNKLTGKFGKKLFSVGWVHGTVFCQVLHVLLIWGMILMLTLPYYLPQQDTCLVYCHCPVLTSSSLSPLHCLICLSGVSFL